MNVYRTYEKFIGYYNISQSKTQKPTRVEQVLVAGDVVAQQVV